MYGPTVLNRLPKYPRIILILLLLWICYLSFPHLPIVKAPFDYARRWNALRVLNNTIWGSFGPKPTYYIPEGRWLDIAGFRKKDGFAWEMLEAWRERCRRFGEMPRWTLQWGEGTWRRNRFKEDDWGDATWEWSGKWVRYTGDLSEKFAGIFGLPHLSLTWDYFTTSQRLLFATVVKSPQGTKAASFHASNIWTASPGGKVTETRPVPHCEYVVYTATSTTECVP